MRRRAGDVRARRRGDHQGLRPQSAATDPCTPAGQRVRDELDPPRFLGRLDGAWSHLPDTHLFLYTYVRGGGALFSDRGHAVLALGSLLFELKEAPGVGWTMWSRCRTMSAQWSMGSSAYETASALQPAHPRDPRHPSSRGGGDRASRRVSSAVARTGSGALDLGMLGSFLLLHSVQKRWASSSSSFTTAGSNPPLLKAALASSSRRSTPSWMATGAGRLLVTCCSAWTESCASRCCT